MIALIYFIWSVSTALFKSKNRLELENAALRHQVVVLQRKVRGRIGFTNRDQLFFILLYRWCPSVLKAMMIVRPETVVRCSLASGWLSSLLALEIAGTGRATANRRGAACFDPAYER